MIQRRRILGSLLAAAALPSTPLQAQTGGPIAFPYYRGEDALAGLYGRHLPALAQDFEARASALVQAAQSHCAGQGTLAGLRQQWLHTLQAWQALATPAVGPLVSRRSQRQIDFWPARPNLLSQAVQKAPQSLADLDRIGTPAKGFPALELLLWNGAHIQKPIEAHRTHAIGNALKGNPVQFPRLTREANLADWRAQWRSLQHQARLMPEQQQRPPLPGQALIPIEALLIGKGQLALADRWAKAIDAVDKGMAALQPQAGARELTALGQRMKSATVLFQNEVAGALDVPLGFSDADGD